MYMNPKSVELTPPAPPFNPFAAYGGMMLPLPTEDEDTASSDAAECLFAKFGGFSLPMPGEHNIQFHEKFSDLFIPKRFKVLRGGRGGLKSWGVARALVAISLMSRKRIIAAREWQVNIADSVHKLLVDQIDLMGLKPWFAITKSSIRATNGSEFIFLGLGDLALKQNRTKIKSLEGADICLVEEAEGISKTTWEILTPTIRKAGSEIWVVYNPDLLDDATYQKFHVHPPPEQDFVEIVTNWRDNVWMSREMLADKNHLFATDAEAAEHVWDGELRKHAEATIFRHKYDSFPFTAQADTTFYHGADWGFSQDPTVLIRCYITGSGQDAELWIDNEAWGTGVDFAVTPGSKALALCQVPSDPNSKPGLFEKISSSKQWPIYGDCSRPETISYVRTMGEYNISGAEKWDGSVEDGITHLRGFKMIHIHPRCVHTLEEFKLYSYKVDRVTGEILPIIIDKYNHCVDAVRYALAKFIQRRGAASIWARLAEPR
jgi:phage terminase large subunit